MKWIEYQKKLGLGFDDNRKMLRFHALMHNHFKNAPYSFFNAETEKTFCDTIGICMLWNDEPFGLQRAWFYLSKHETNFRDFLSCCVALVNAYSEQEKDIKQWLKTTILDSLDDCQINYELLSDADGIFIFPKGAKELDDALVSEPLEWLEYYPRARKTYIIALKQYSDGIYIRDVADNLRKALETFLQEFLGNDKNLESNKNEICKYLGQQGVDSGISGLFQPLINAYKNTNDRIAKHNDHVDGKLLEFLLYQTGILIRMVISIKNARDKNDT